MPQRTCSLILLLLLVSGCALLPQAGPKGPAKAPVTGERGRIPSSIRAEAVVEFTGRDSVKGKAVILAKRPDLFRIDILGPFHQTVAQLVSDGRGISIYTADGPIEGVRAGDVLESYFDAAEVVDLLLGTAEGEKAPEGWSALSSDRGDSLRFVKKISGAGVISIVMEDFRKVDGAILPFSISVRGDKEGLSIRYSTVEIDPELNQELFKRSP